MTGPALIPVAYSFATPTDLGERRYRALCHRAGLPITEGGTSTSTARCSAGPSAPTSRQTCFMAERMGATTARIDGSHVAFISRPVAVAAFVMSAVDKLS
jgi:hypothetical protein